MGPGALASPLVSSTIESGPTSPAPLPSSIAGTFPTRPLRVSRTGTPAPMLMLFLGLFTVALSIGILVGGAANVLPDVTIRANPKVLDAATLDGQCETKKVVFTICDATITYEVAGVPQRVERDYYWIGTAQEYTTDVVVAADRPELATVSVAIDKLWNRVLSILGAFALILGFGLMTLRQWSQARGARSTYKPETAQQLFPVVVNVVGAKDIKLRGRSYEFTGVVDGKKRKWQQLLNKAEGAPFLVGPGSALAVHAEGAQAHPVLLDAGLTRLDLTEEERAQLSSPSRPGDDVS